MRIGFECVHYSPDIKDLCMKRSLYLYASILMVGVIGCTPATYLIRSPEQSSPTIKNIVLLPPKVTVYEVSAGGNSEKKDDWSQKGVANIQTGLVTSFKKKTNIQFNVLMSDSTNQIQQNNLHDVDVFYDAVNRCIVSHAYSSSLDYFKDKKEHFDYAVDTSIAALDSTADAFLVVRGKDYLASSGRAAVQVASVLLGALAGIQVTPNSLPTEVETALIDSKTGAVLWHSAIVENGTYNLRDITETSSLFKKMLKGMPVK
jgi:hypothetical protein